MPLVQNDIHPSRPHGNRFRAASFQVPGLNAYAAVPVQASQPGASSKIGPNSSRISAIRVAAALPSSEDWELAKAGAVFDKFIEVGVCSLRTTHRG